MVDWRNRHHENHPVMCSSETHCDNREQLLSFFGIRAHHYFVRVKRPFIATFNTFYSITNNWQLKIMVTTAYIFFKSYIF